LVAVSLAGPYVHHIDPIIGSILGVYLWWYGLTYTLGFLNAHWSIQRKRAQLGLSLRSAYSLSILLAAGVLLGGRFIEVAFYEWPFYREHLYLIPAYWLGGMATHGLLFGGMAGIWVFCRLEARSFLTITDALAIPAAVILGVGRVGNFIDGHIVGSVTSVWWAVKFPDVEGFRHPAVLYDGLKNFLIIPIVWMVARRAPPTGVVTGVFLFLYAFLRIFIDFFREYPTSLMGLATGQVLNLLMSLLGLVLMVAPLWRKRQAAQFSVGLATHLRDDLVSTGIASRRILFGALLLFALVIPSDWTQDVPAQYGKRHPGVVHSAIYPQINTMPRGAEK